MTLLVPFAHVRKTSWAALLRSASCRRIDTKSRRAPRKLAKLADERGKLLQAFYANAIPLDLLKAEQDRIGVAEQATKVELVATEGDLNGWQDVLQTAIRLAGNCHAAY